MESMEGPRLGCGLLTAALVGSVMVSFMFGGLALFAIPFAFFPVLTVVTAFGLPLYMLARRWGKAGWATAGLAGLAAGLIATGLSDALLGSPFIADFGLGAIGFGVAGLTGGLTFWAIVRPREDEL